MGNTSSSGSSGSTRSHTSNNNSSSGHHHNLVNAITKLKSTGSLGLSKSELDKRCKPSGLYLSCPWDDKAIRRLIGDGKLAPRLVGSDERQHSSYRECPICFLHYSQINITSCCKAYICSECYLQIKPQKNDYCCPFCTSPKLNVGIANEVDEHELKKIEEEEQEEIRLKKMSSSCCVGDDGFGKSLERHNSRLRSDSTVSSDDSTLDQRSELMSAEERKALEEEMKQQHLHPLTRQLELEAEERRREHDNSYRRRNPAFATGRLRFSNGNVSAAALHRSLIAHGGSRPRVSTLGGSTRRRERDWNQVVEAFENQFGDQVNSLDDLVVIEAAILLSMEEEAAHRRRQRNGNEEEESNRSSFPLFHTLMRPRGSDNEDDNETDTNNSSTTVPLSSFRRGRRYYSRNRSALEDSANLIMRGVSEEEQIAMAIALSLRESQGIEANSDAAQASETTQASNDDTNPNDTNEDTATTANEDTAQSESNQTD